MLLAWVRVHPADEPEHGMILATKAWPLAGMLQIFNLLHGQKLQLYKLLDHTRMSASALAVQAVA